MKRLILLLNLTVFSFILAGQSADPPKYISLEPYDFHMAYLKADTAKLIDVREHFEFRGRRIRDAINIPSSDNLEISFDTIDKSCSLFFYCTTDYRSIRVAEYFHDRGFKNVYNLEGGIVAWKKDGFPLSRRGRRK